MLKLKGSVLDWHVAPFCFIQTVKSKDFIMVISGFTLSSIPGYDNGTSGKVSGHVKLFGWVLSMAHPVCFKGTRSSTDKEQISILQKVFE